ncbi:hypothetical protein [Pseudoalteromonas sp. Angola-18]|uniref:hypothetical protein n=1 Tax=Pseudoalteromonas sp. Angola-18 TaxID=3025338 RepID=UPI002358D0FB|nr:hypothetical protein [Pseudoalteromonas sp. Angola-18]MDC9502840.1 hypothetical protein [Pseudoalteromonas sp. Angola-18]
MRKLKKVAKNPKANKNVISNLFNLVGLVTKCIYLPTYLVSKLFHSENFFGRLVVLFIWLMNVISLMFIASNMTSTTGLFTNLSNFIVMFGLLSAVPVLISRFKKDMI